MTDRTPQDYKSLAIYKKGRAKGYEQGFSAGYRRGFAAGMADRSITPTASEDELDQMHDARRQGKCTTPAEAAAFLGWKQKRARRVWDTLALEGETYEQ